MRIYPRLGSLLESLKFPAFVCIWSTNRTGENRTGEPQPSRLHHLLPLLLFPFVFYTYYFFVVFTIIFSCSSFSFFSSFFFFALGPSVDRFVGSFVGSFRRAEKFNRENQPSGGRARGAIRGPTRGATRGPTHGSNFAFACSARRQAFAPAFVCVRLRLQTPPPPVLLHPFCGIPQRTFVNFFFEFAWGFGIEKWRNKILGSTFPKRQSTNRPREIRAKFGEFFGTNSGQKCETFEDSSFCTLSGLNHSCANDQKGFHERESIVSASAYQKN